MVKVAFNWNYGGQEVLLYGSFTKWDTCYKLKDSRITINLEPGIYEYKFMVDGEWMYDLKEPHVSNCFNSRNNIIRVKEGNGLDIVSIGDLCGKWEEVKIPEADVLVVAGNIVGDTYKHPIREQLEKFNTWIGKVKIPYKLVVFGSKDLELRSKIDPVKKISKLLYNCKVLNGDVYEIGNFKFFGIEHKFKNWAGMAVNSYDDVWSSIPKDLDVLITNTSPYGILDDYYGYPQGSEILRHRLSETTPTLHIFSTTVSSKEETRLKTWNTGRQTLFVNSKISNDDKQIKKSGVTVHLS